MGALWLKQRLKVEMYALYRACKNPMPDLCPLRCEGKALNFVVITVDLQS